MKTRTYSESRTKALKETACLLKNPENARQLLASIDRLEHGNGIERNLLDDSEAE